jgi:hypothetical protein
MPEKELKEIAIELKLVWVLRSATGPRMTSIYYIGKHNF